MKEVKIGMKVIDRWYSFCYKNNWGCGKIVKIKKTRIIIKFNNLDQPVSYDQSHLQFLSVFSKNLEISSSGFVKENKKNCIKFKNQSI